MLGTFKKLLSVRSRVFFDLYELSANNTLEMAKLYTQMADTPEPGSNNNVVFQKIEELEKQNDEITHRISFELNRIFITPISREDILDLANLLDDVSDKLYSAARQLLLLGIKGGDASVGLLADKIVQSTGEILKLMRALKTHQHEAAMRSIEVVRELAAQTSTVYDQVLANLYGREIDFRTFIKKREVYMVLLSAAEKSRNVANYADNIMWKHVM